MIHYVKQSLGPDGAGLQIVVLACAKKAKVKLSVEEGSQLCTAEGGNSTLCPGCAEALQSERLRRIKAAEKEAKNRYDAGEPDWRGSPSQDASLGEAQRDDGMDGPLEDTSGR